LRTHQRTRVLSRLAALCLLAFAIVAATALPASAHASLLSTEPSPSGVYATSPSAITLRFSEPVEVSLGGVKVFEAKTEQRVNNGPPEHPDGEGSFVTSDLPKLKNGTYVVTWRVVSADSHPVEGAFTFQVGSHATVNNAQGIATTLLETSKGDRAVGIVYGFQRAILYAALALLIGGAAFVAFLWPRGRADRRAAWLVLGGWLGAVIATVAGIALEGVYGAGLPLSKLFDPSLFSDVLDTRYGHVALVRLGLLACALPLLWFVFGRKGAANRPLPPWWIVPGALVAIGLALTPGLAGHASTGIQTKVAIPLDALHVLGMAVWLGGLAVLVVALLPRRDTVEMRAVLPRWSTTALGCVLVLIATGIYQSWRLVGSINALRDTDSGRLLIAKVAVFAVLVVVASFARDVVNRRYREYEDDFEDLDDLELEVPVAVGVMASDLGPDPDAPPRPPAPEPDDPDEDGRTEAGEQRRLRRTVWIEVLLMVVVLGITAALVNAAPARTQSTQPVFMTLKSDEMWFDVTIAPGSAGANDIHLTALPTGGGLTQVQQIQVQLTQPGRDLPPFEVPMQKLGTNHFYAPQFDIPYPGTWEMTIRAQLSEVDETVATGRFSLR
jgi:copper transport protein